MEPERREIIEYILKTGVAEQCVFFQTLKCRDKELIADLKQELYLWLCTYDLNKLKNAYDEGHINALITRWVINNYYSRSSPFHKYFRKFQEITDELSPKEYNIADNIK